MNRVSLRSSFHGKRTMVVDKRQHTSGTGRPQPGQGTPITLSGADRDPGQDKANKRCHEHGTCSILNKYHLHTAQRVNIFQNAIKTTVKAKIHDE
jgi:hypothetical protein